MKFQEPIQTDASRGSYFCIRIIESTTIQDILRNGNNPTEERYKIRRDWLWPVEYKIALTNGAYALHTAEMQIGNLESVWCWKHGIGVHKE